MRETSSSQIISPRLMRIAELAERAPDMVLTTLAHHIDEEFLFEAYRRTRRDGAVGVDGQSAEEFEENLTENLDSLLRRAKDGSYRAPPVRRVNIPKGDGKKTRPIGIPTFEDKILQRAVTMVLEAVYEQDFLDLSWGFRPGRSTHLAVEATKQELSKMKNGGWVLEVDIQGFFDALDHKQLREIVRQRVNDGVILRLIGKWLHAGVMEDGEVKRSSKGTPQGGVISPLLANIYLHEVFDKWFEGEIKPRMHRRCFATRYADDIIIGFESEEDARRVLKVLSKRFGKYGLKLHPDKTRLVEFRRPSGSDDEPRGKGGERTTFDTLGFTLYWDKSPRGKWKIKQKTMNKRLHRAVKAIWRWCRNNRHLPIVVQHQTLTRKLKGHYAYYGVSHNSRSIDLFRHWATRAWRYWLDRRSNKAGMNWEKFRLLLKHHPLPAARIVHREQAIRAKLHKARSRMH
jgi:RNA-directed DNA polymerase